MLFQRHFIPKHNSSSHNNYKYLLPALYEYCSQRPLCVISRNNCYYPLTDSKVTFIQITTSKTRTLFYSVAFKLLEKFFSSVLKSLKPDKLNPLRTTIYDKKYSCTTFSFAYNQFFTKKKRNELKKFIKKVYQKKLSKKLMKKIYQNSQTTPFHVFTKKKKKIYIIDVDEFCFFNLWRDTYFWSRGIKNLKLIFVVLPQLVLN